MQKVCHVAAIYCTNKDEVKLSLSQRWKDIEVKNTPLFTFEKNSVHWLGTYGTFMAYSCIFCFLAYLVVYQYNRSTFA